MVARQDSRPNPTRLPSIQKAEPTLRPLFLRSLNCLRHFIQFLLVEHVGINHAHQNLTPRAFAEPIDNTLHGFGCHMLARLRGAIEERAAFGGVDDKALGF